VVHGTDEDAFAARLVAAAPATSATRMLAIAVVVLKETGLAGGLRFGRLRLEGLRLLVLGLGLLRLAIGLRLAALVPLTAATAAMAALSLVLTLVGSLRLSRDRIFCRGLRLVLLCCHSCTSWCDGLFVPVPPAASSLGFA
jgi:hypothetical protein